MSFLKSLYVHPLEVPWTWSLRVFMETSLHRQEHLNHWPLEIDSTSRLSLLSLPKVLSVGRKVIKCL